MAKFQLLAGTYHADGRVYAAGSIIETEKDLAAESPHKFKLLTGRNTGLVTDHGGIELVGSPGPGGAVPGPFGTPPRRATAPPPPAAEPQTPPPPAAEPQTPPPPAAEPQTPPPPAAVLESAPKKTAPPPVEKKAHESSATKG